MFVIFWDQSCDARWSRSLLSRLSLSSNLEGAFRLPLVVGELLPPSAALNFGAAGAADAAFGSVNDVALTTGIFLPISSLPAVALATFGLAVPMLPAGTAFLAGLVTAFTAGFVLDALATTLTFGLVTLAGAGTAAFGFTGAAGFALAGALTGAAALAFGFAVTFATTFTTGLAGAGLAAGFATTAGFLAGAADLAATAFFATGTTFLAASFFSGLAGAFLLDMIVTPYGNYLISTKGLLNSSPIHTVGGRCKNLQQKISLLRENVLTFARDHSIHE